jgi:hypothetical protein
LDERADRVGRARPLAHDVPDRELADEDAAGDQPALRVVQEARRVARQVLRLCEQRRNDQEEDEHPDRTAGQVHEAGRTPAWHAGAAPEPAPLEQPNERRETDGDERAQIDEEDRLPRQVQPERERGPGVQAHHGQDDQRARARRLGRGDVERRLVGMRVIRAGHWRLADDRSNSSSSRNHLTAEHWPRGAL